MWVLTEVVPSFEIGKLQLIHMTQFVATFFFLSFFFFTTARETFEAGEGCGESVISIPNPPPPPQHDKFTNLWST